MTEDQSSESKDYQNVSSNPDIKSAIKNEEILFSDMVEKENHYGFNQKRLLVITENAVYNFKGNTKKREINHHLIKGVSVSKLSDQFVIHGDRGEYDYIYSSPKKVEIVAAIERGHEICCGKEILLAALDLKKLYDFVTTKKEKIKEPELSKINKDFLVDVQEYLAYKGELDLRRYMLEEKNRVHYSKFNKYNKDISFDDYELLNVIGKGHGSMVCTAKRKKDGEIFALKFIDKLYLLDHKLYDQVMMEKNLLSSLAEEREEELKKEASKYPKTGNHNFFISAESIFMTEHAIVFVMPFLPGGDLYHLLVKANLKDKKKGIGDMNVAFYCVQVALMLQYLHKKNIVYRDLKPENLLLNNDGYLKLIDFGQSKVLLEQNEMSTSFCGTTEYMSPEMINGGGYNKSTDWWSFGVLVYELLCGVPPFFGDSLESTYDLIIYGDLKFPSCANLSDAAKDLCRKVRKKFIYIN